MDESDHLALVNTGDEEFALPGGLPERPVVLTCVAHTGVASLGGGDQAPRYYPLAQSLH